MYNKCGEIRKEKERKMTKEEFREHLKSYGKKKGEYTKEELFEIGVKYKDEVDKEERSWSWLVDELGDYRDGEGFRKWLLSKRYTKKLVPKNPKVLDDKTVYDVTSEDIEGSLTQQREDLFKEKTQLRDTYNAYRRGMREEARIDAFKSHLIDAMGRLESLPKVEPMPSEGMEQTEMVLGFADLHLGISFKNSYNEYSPAIAARRVSKLVSQTIKYCHANGVRRLSVLNIGDLVSGLIHPSLRLEQSIDVADQVMQAAEMLAEALNQLQAAAPEVVYRSVVDNHSRLTPNKESHIEVESFNRIIDWFVEERLKGTSVEFPKDNLDVGVGRFKLLNGKTMMFAHGHQDKKSSIFQDMVGLTKEYPDYIFIGHYHNSAEHTFQGAKVFISGSIVGTDTYAYGKRLFGEPEQKALIFDGDDVIDIDINLR